MGKSWLTSGNAYGLQDGSTYIKHHDTLTPFVWGGRCWRLEDSSETLGGVTVTTRFDPRGGIERDTVRAEPPGETSGTLVMKRLQADRAKTDLRRCYWDLDQRMQCGGMDRDAWTRWQEITRYCHAKFNERGLAGTAWEGDEDALVNFPYVALSVDDIYRVAGSENTAVADPITVDIVDVDVCQPQRCPDHCDDQEDCVVVAVTLHDTGTTYLLSNLAGGDDDNWTATSLAAFSTGTDSADKVLCMGDFVVALSAAYPGIIITHISSLATQTAVTAPWATNAPACIDGIDQSFIIVGAAAGYIMVSYDAGVNWEEVSSGEATTNAIGDIMIARDNPQVIYASSSAADVVIKSENGGRTWDALTATGCGTGLTAMYVVNQSTVIVGNSTGQVRQTVDGGIVWTEQEDLPLPAGSAKADVTITDITGCGCGVLYLTAMETSIAPRIYRNVDGGAEGRWYRPADIGTLTATTGPAKAIACCGPNHAVAVGGGTTTVSSTLLIE